MTLISGAERAKRAEFEAMGMPLGEAAQAAAVEVGIIYGDAVGMEYDPDPEKV